ncbi:MAG: class I SAM-dependent methyltransferase [Betaproteobacteria bacterium]|nr:MAG: class I SAM-dependent methyltransferase [Betaproteobacteria bacterium]
MSPQEYDAWYASSRGAWIGETEYALLRRLLGAERRASVLDVGCGTGYFSRRFARDGHPVTGVDLDPAMVEFARTHAAAGETYWVADAHALPFGDRSFDYCVSVTALCFVRDERKALEEMVRVAHRGVALGLLNRHSLLYWQKGRHGGSGTYRGAHWHTAREAQSLLAGLPLDTPRIRSAVFLAAGGAGSRRLEAQVSNRVLWGGFLAVAAARS